MTPRRRPVPVQIRPASDVHLLAAIDALARHLPPMECRGKCQGACQGIDMSPAEHRRITARGYDIIRRPPLPGGRVTRCQALTQLGTCGVYDVRPAVCRLWGLTQSMSCAYGCRPEGGFLSERIGLAYLMSVQAIADGHPITWEEALAANEHLDDPDVLKAYRNHMAAGSNDYGPAVRAAAEAQYVTAIRRWRQRRTTTAAGGD